MSYISCVKSIFLYFCKNSWFLSLFERKTSSSIFNSALKNLLTRCNLYLSSSGSLLKILTLVSSGRLLNSVISIKSFCEVSLFFCCRRVLDGSFGYCGVSEYNDVLGE